METWDLLDKNGQPTGKIGIRGDTLEKGDYHLVVFVWLQTPDGRYLISKRQTDKKGGGLWETTGGAALSGESSRQAACREVYEELGLRLNPSNGKKIKRLRFDTAHGWFADVWLFRQAINLKNLRLQTTEVSDVRLMSSTEIDRHIAAGQFFHGQMHKKIGWQDH